MQRTHIHHFWRTSTTATNYKRFGSHDSQWSENPRSHGSGTIKGAADHLDVKANIPHLVTQSLQNTECNVYPPRYRIRSASLLPLHSGRSASPRTSAASGHQNGARNERALIWTTLSCHPTLHATLSPNKSRLAIHLQSIVPASVSWAAAVLPTFAGSSHSRAQVQIGGKTDRPTASHLPIVSKGRSSLEPTAILRGRSWVHEHIQNTAWQPLWNQSLWNAVDIIDRPARPSHDGTNTGKQTHCLPNQNQNQINMYSLLQSAVCVLQTIVRNVVDVHYAGLCMCCPRALVLQPVDWQIENKPRIRFG